MSVLAWLFGLGILAGVFPLVFHLIRQTPKGHVNFSSLMFLSPSPPRLTRRRHLDNLLLLALRVAAVTLIAVAFMRPFVRHATQLKIDEIPGRRIAVLVDNSASMMRGDLWQQVQQKAKMAFENADSGDAIALYSFDTRLVCQRSFATPTRPGDVEQIFADGQLEPTWRPSDLGSALTGLADELQQTRIGQTRLQITVITDMQEGSSLSALQNYQWPPQVKVNFDRVQLPGDSTNASLESLPIQEGLSPGTPLVQVRNAAGSTTDKFSVHWDGASDNQVPFVVPPGTSIILPVPRGTSSRTSSKLQLHGDQAEFDNAHFVVPPHQQLLTVAYLGDENRDDPEQMLYYLERCLLETPSRKVTVVQPGLSPIQGAVLGHSQADLIVITAAIDELEKRAVNQFLEAGGTVLIVAHNSDIVESTLDWTGVDEYQLIAAPNEYSMWVDIQFAHPLFAPLAGARFNDFTQIRFWEYLAAELPEPIQILARFDDGHPAVWQSDVSNGRVMVIASGWQPSQSQLALSSKFLPLISCLVDLATDSPQVHTSGRLGQPVVIPPAYSQARFENVTLDLDREKPIHEQIDKPGIYQFSCPDDASLPELTVAFNVAPSESQTAIMPLDQLAALNVQLGLQADQASDIERQRKLQDVEIESRQQLWKWIIVAAIGLLILETWIAGKTDRQKLALNASPKEAA